MLSLQNPNYQPPTGYAIWGNPNNTAWPVYDCIEHIKNSKWFTNLQQYNITKLEYRGWSLSPLLLEGTIHVILPSIITLNGYLTNWLAYHDEDVLSFCYAVAPSTTNKSDMTFGVTHEIFEALTDSPPGAGWIVGNEEGADPCEGTPLQVGGYTVSSYWSNTHNRCLAQTDL